MLIGQHLNTIRVPLEGHIGTEGSLNQHFLADFGLGAFDHVKLEEDVVVDKTETIEQLRHGPREHALLIGRYGWLMLLLLLWL